MKRFIRICTVAATLSLITVGAWTQETKPSLVAAPDIVPPATAEMQKASFWISRLEGDPDRVIMTPAQIDALNRKNRTRSLERKDIDGNTVMIDSVTVNIPIPAIRFYVDDPLAVTAFSGEVVRGMLNENITKLKDANLWDRRRIEYPDWKKQELIRAECVDDIPGRIVPEHGVVVRHTQIRVHPSHDAVYAQQDGWLDMFQFAVVETGSAVAVLHGTLDGEWLFVRTSYTTGWVPAENIAIGTPEAIRRFADPERFVVSIDHRVPVHTENGSWIGAIHMGARLPLVAKISGDYRVIVPIRDAAGMLATAEGVIDGGAEVSDGFQTYTRANAIDTFFRLLNRPYGWGGTDHERDCVGSIRAVFRTFGIDMPRWTVFSQFYTDHVYHFSKDLPKDEKYRLLSRCEPGITVTGFDWHVLLYLGQVDGVHYCIHQNGFSYHDPDGTEKRIARVSVNYTEIEGGGDINLWTTFSEFKP